MFKSSSSPSTTSSSDTSTINDLHETKLLILSMHKYCSSTCFWFFGMKIFDKLSMQNRIQNKEQNTEQNRGEIFILQFCVAELSLLKYYLHSRLLSLILRSHYHSCFNFCWMNCLLACCHYWINWLSMVTQLLFFCLLFVVTDRQLVAIRDYVCQSNSTGYLGRLFHFLFLFSWWRASVHGRAGVFFPAHYARARRRAQWKNISCREFKFWFVKFNFTEGSEFFNSIF